MCPPLFMLRAVYHTYAKLSLFHFSSCKVTIFWTRTFTKSKSLLVLIFSLGLVTYIIHAEQMGVLTILVWLSVLSLCIFSPIENQARKLSEKERIVFRTVARGLSLIFLAIYFYLSFHASIQYSAAFGVGVLLVGILQIPCVLGKAPFPKLNVETKREWPKRQEYCHLAQQG